MGVLPRALPCMGAMPVQWDRLLGGGGEAPAFLIDLNQLEEIILHKASYPSPLHYQSFHPPLSRSHRCA